MTSPDDRRASWLRELCPAWCARAHHEDDHPEDHYHQSEASFVPVIASRRTAVPVTSTFEAVDMLVRICRYDGDVVTWLAIEPLEQRQPRLVLTVESARLLVRDMVDQLRRHDGEELSRG